MQSESIAFFAYINGFTGSKSHADRTQEWGLDDR